MASHIVGYPRMGPKRELKSIAGDLQKVAADLSVVRFLVLECGRVVRFSYACRKAVTEYKKAKARGVDTVPVLVGPVSYLLLSKPAKGVEESFSLLSLLGEILPIYKEVITELKEAGASWIQFDEPTLVMDLESHKLHAFTEAYSALESTLSGSNVLIETCFADIPAEQYKTLTSLKGVTAFGFDVVRGRNIWANDLAASLSNLETLEGIVRKDKLDTNVSARLDAQQKKLNLPVLPTTTIGSFPHTMELRKVRREYIAKKVSEDDYVKAIMEGFRKGVKLQEEFDIDVLVHGGQRCGGPKLFVIEETKGYRDLFDYTEDDLWHCLPEVLKEEFVISPPAISRSPIPKNMMVKITANSCDYKALIDTGSTYNVLHPRVAEKMGLKITEDDPIWVRTADGSIMCSEGSCPEFKFGIQGGQFATPAYILPLGGFDVILGIEWLRGLGPIKNWDFASLKMELTQEGKTIQIKGMDTEESEAGCSADKKVLSMVHEGVKYGAGIVYDIHSPRVPSTEEIKHGAGIGPGVFDIHSPRVPSTEEIADGINKMLAVLKTIQVNPDCGLKTRKCTEVKPPLKNKLLRSQLVSAK